MFVDWVILLIAIVKVVMIWLGIEWRSMVMGSYAQFMWEAEEEEEENEVIKIEGTMVEAF